MLNDKSGAVAEEAQGIAEGGFQAFIQFMLIVMAVSITLWFARAIFNALKRRHLKRKLQAQLNGHSKKSHEHHTNKLHVESLQKRASTDDRKKILEEQRAEWKRQQEQNRR